MTSRLADDPEGALDWHFYDIREHGHITAAAAYRTGEYVYCQRGPDDGMSARAKVGQARPEVPDNPREWDDLATYRALLFGVAGGRDAEAFGVAAWGSSADALDGIVGVLAGGLDQDSEVTTFAFPSHEITSRHMRPDPAARQERESSEAAARVQAAHARARAAEEREAAARRAARAEAQDDAIHQAKLRTEQTSQLAERLQDTDPFTADDLLAAFAAAGEGLNDLADWGRAIVDAVEQFADAEAQDFLSRILFSFLKDTAVKRYQTLTPFRGLREAPAEINVVYQDHVDGLEHLLRVREDVLSDLLSDLTWRFTQHLGTLTWGELARFGAVRDQPAPPVGFDDLED
jgi:hypothetical protein